MFVEDEHGTLGNDSTVDFTDSKETAEVSNYFFPKHKEDWTRRQKINADELHLILCEIPPCRMLLMTELLVKMLIHTTALKSGRNWWFRQPASGVLYILQEKNGVTRGAKEESN